MPLSVKTIILITIIPIQTKQWTTISKYTSIIYEEVFFLYKIHKNVTKSLFVGVMVSLLESRTEDRGSKPLSLAAYFSIPLNKSNTLLVNNRTQVKKNIECNNINYMLLYSSSTCIWSISLMSEGLHFTHM